jgi:hypothetical protein
LAIGLVASAALVVLTWGVAALSLRAGAADLASVASVASASALVK